jgi:SPOR domain
VSTTHTPPPAGASQPPAAPERRCPRCGSALSPDQEWCLACGAAADTEIAEPRGWRVPIVVGGGLVALAIVAILLVIFALARNGKEQVAQVPPPTPTPSIVASATATPVPSTTPAPGATATATASPSGTATVDPNATPTPSPGASTTPDPNATPTPSPAAGSTPDPNTDSGSTGTSGFSGWPGGNGWTIIIESATTQSKAQKVAKSAQDSGETVGILHSDDFSSLNAGYWVVFTQKYASEKSAEAALSTVQASHKAAYVRQVKPQS